MKAEGYIRVVIDEEGNARVSIEQNDSPDHFELLKPMLAKLSDGNPAQVHAHRHDHAHGHSHSHVGGEHPHTH